jgi:hypothetical protein
MTTGIELVGGLGILRRGDSASPPPDPRETRFWPIFEALASHGARPELILYADEAVDAVRRRLLQLGGVLVWIDPIVNGRDRSVLDTMLRDVASRGVFVSAHPDVILKMGTKDVLYRTRQLPWGTDTRRYGSLEELCRELPLLLRSGEARVLKQHRGNGWNGVWKVELVTDASPATEAILRVHHAARGARMEEVSFGHFVDRCRPYFAGTGCMLDQPYQERLADGMVRCYLVHDRVVGFGHQMVTALLPPPPGESAPPDPPARHYFGPSKPEFQALRELLETAWVVEMQGVLDIHRESLPVIWDADFLFGPKAASGEDTYVLCEINVSSVYPMPDEAVAPLAEAAVARVLAAQQAR